jgi:hypothetical protein
MEEEWSRRFQNLGEKKQYALSSSWTDLYRSIQETDRDWAKMEDLRNEINTRSPRRFSTAYKAFKKVYEPPQSGTALGVFLLETDQEGNYTGLEEFSEALNLGTPTEETEIDIDSILEHH